MNNELAPVIDQTEQGRLSRLGARVSEFASNIAERMPTPQLPELSPKAMTYVALGAAALGGGLLAEGDHAGTANAAHKHRFNSGMRPAKMLEKIRRVEASQSYNYPATGGPRDMNLKRGSLSKDGLVLGGKCDKDPYKIATKKYVETNTVMTRVNCYTDRRTGKLVVSKYKHDAIDLEPKLVQLGNQAAKSVKIAKESHADATSIKASKSQATIMYERLLDSQVPQLKKLKLRSGKKPVEVWYP